MQQILTRYQIKQHALALWLGSARPILAWSLRSGPTTYVVQPYLQCETSILVQGALPRLEDLMHLTSEQGFLIEFWLLCCRFAAVTRIQFQQFCSYGFIWLLNRDVSSDVKRPAYKFLFFV